MPTLSQTLLAVRQQIANDFTDLYTGTVVSGTAGGTGTTGKITANSRAVHDVPAGSLRGADLTIFFAAGTQETQTITNNTYAAGIVTLEVSQGGWGTTPAASDTFEITNIGGRGFKKVEYDNAIFEVIDALADYDWSDYDTVQLAIERRSGRGGMAPMGVWRDEYPLPSGLNGISGVDVLYQQPMTGLGTGALTSYRSLGDVTARTRIAQGFQVQIDSLIGYIAFYMGIVGVPADNLSCVVETDLAGVPSTTAVTNGTSGNIASTTLQVRPRYVVFTFNPPMLLLEAVQYHATLRRSSAVSASNYYTVGEDNTGVYGYGRLSLYNPTTWSTVAGTGLIFAASLPGASWIPLAKKYWSYVPAISDQLKIKAIDNWYEGTPIRIRGGAPIARPTTETGSIPIRPEFVTTAAKQLLRLNRTGRAMIDNSQQGAQGFFARLGLQPPPRRAFPVNWTPVTT